MPSASRRSPDAYRQGATRSLSDDAYATDGSNYRQIPIGLVIPRDAADVVAAVAICRAHRAPVLSRGAGTSLAGQCCNVAVVLDFTKYMNRILEIDPVQRIARVQPGVVLDTLRNAAEVHKLTFGPDPSTHSRCTLGGMIGNNCAARTAAGRKMVDNVRLHILRTSGPGCRRVTEAAAIDASSAAVAAVGKSTPAFDIRDRYADRIREALPHSAACVRPLDELLPENAFTSPGPSLKRRMHNRARGTARLI
jgi:FAD/FMN-containing dehydrogenase